MEKEQCKETQRIYVIGLQPRLTTARTSSCLIVGGFYIVELLQNRRLLLQNRLQLPDINTLHSPRAGKHSRHPGRLPCDHELRLQPEGTERHP